ncbi:MAG: hypothetical protein WEC59_09615 [Salibacteraceae bacterium]
MKKIVAIVLLLLLVVIDASAQCSMCSAVVESSQKTGSEFAEGLNAGILYLMGIPYALLIGMGIMLFRRMNQNRTDSEV